MNEAPGHAATPAKRTKRPYVKKASLKKGDGTTKPAPKPAPKPRKKAADSCQKEIGGFLIEQEENGKVVEATKTVQLPVERPPPTHSVPPAAGNAAAHSPERTELNENSAVEMVVMETGKPQKGDLFDVASQTISRIKEEWDALQTASAADRQNIESLKTEIEELQKAKKARNTSIVNLIRDAQVTKQDHNSKVTKLYSQLTDAHDDVNQRKAMFQELSRKYNALDATVSSHLRSVDHWRDESTATSKKLVESVQEFEAMKGTQKSIVDSWTLERDQLKAELDRTKTAQSALEICLTKERDKLKAEIKRIKRAPLELVMLKRGYDQLNNEFKDLKESKAAELDALNQRLDGTQKTFTRLNNKYRQLFEVASDVGNYAGSMANDCYGEAGRAIKKLKSELQDGGPTKI
jgi:chromosome segregation ATPase